MRDKSYAYMAGIMDGEGHIAVSKGMYSEAYQKERNLCGTTWNFTLNIGCTSTDPRLIKWITDHFGGTVYTDKRQRQGWKCARRWRILGRPAQQKFLLGILPYLVIKREQASLALDWIKMGSIEDQKARMYFFEMFAKLNRRGELPETNTSDTNFVKIESVLTGDSESATVVIQ